jgi:hypothetical protein
MGSQGLPTLSQNAPPPLMRAAVHRAMTPGGVVHYGVLANQRANDRCSVCGTVSVSHLSFRKRRV